MLTLIIDLTIGPNINLIIKLTIDINKQSLINNEYIKRKTRLNGASLRKKTKLTTIINIII